MENLEKRSIINKNTVNSESRTVHGTALVFNSWSQDLGGFTEIIKPEAVNEETIQRSDIMANMDHREDYVMARSKRGNGNLALSLTERGVDFSFEAPETAKGEELLSHIKRGEYDSCSFAFRIAPDGDRWFYENDQLKREIRKIDILYDISIVYAPAYEETSVDVRAKQMVDAFKELRSFKTQFEELANSEKVEEINTRMIECRALTPEEKKELEDKINEMKALKEEINALEDKIDELDEKVEDSVEEVEKIEAQNDAKEAAQEPEAQPEVNTSTEATKEPETQINKQSDEDKKSQKRNKIYKSTKSMDENRFSLVRALRCALNHEELNPIDAAVIKAGQTQMRDCGFASTPNSIQLPVESRTVTVNGFTPEGEGATPVAGVHDDVIQTDFTSILEPLYAKSVLAQAGVTFLTGVKNDIQIPIMTGQTVGWAGEIDKAMKTQATFAHKKMSPKRITAYTEVSKMLLAQDNLSVENAIIRDLGNALADKIEATILGKAAATDNQPAGIGNGLSATTISTYEGICDFEASLETTNLIGAPKYIMSPQAKAKFRAMAKSSKSTELVFEGGTLDGTPVLSTTNVASKDFYYGIFSNVYVATFGSLELLLDPYSASLQNSVRIVINAFVDEIKVRDNAILLGKVQ